MGHVSPFSPTTIRINRHERVVPGITVSAFNMAPVDLAHLLAHEDRHVQQLAGHGIIERLRMALFDDLESDAEAYATRNVIRDGGSR
jgi:hypothetical protein